MKLLEGKNALITGASKGIGRAIALHFAAHGANIAFTYLSSVEQGQALEQELNAKGVKAKGYRSDAATSFRLKSLSTASLRISEALTCWSTTPALHRTTFCCA